MGRPAGAGGRGPGAGLEMGAAGLAGSFMPGGNG
jgi:hypothetical protein